MYNIRCTCIRDHFFKLQMLNFIITYLKNKQKMFWPKHYKFSAQPVKQQNVQETNKRKFFYFSYSSHDLRVRLGEWDVNHDVEFYPYIERDVQNLFIHPEFYAGTLFNDLAILRIDRPVDFTQSPHISPACLPEPFTDYSGQRCWTTGWGKDAFGDYGKYQNILKVSYTNKLKKIIKLNYKFYT